MGPGLLLFPNVFRMHLLLLTQHGGEKYSITDNDLILCVAFAKLSVTAKSLMILLTSVILFPLTFCWTWSLVFGFHSSKYRTKRT